MAHYDHNAPQYHITTPGKVNSDRLTGLFPADRAARDNTPGVPSRFPQLPPAIDQLENDHPFLDQALDQAEQVFAVLHAYA